MLRSRHWQKNCAAKRTYKKRTLAGALSFLSSVFLQIAVNTGRNAEFLLEGPIERRIIGKTNLCGHLLQRNSLGDQIFGRDQPPLQQYLMETDAHYIPEGTADFPFADKMADITPVLQEIREGKIDFEKMQGKTLTKILSKIQNLQKKKLNAYHKQYLREKF